MDDLENLPNYLLKEQQARTQVEKILLFTNKRLTSTASSMALMQEALEEQQTEKSRAIEKAKKEIFMANLKLSYLIRNLPTGVMLEDEEHKVLHTNEKFCQIFDLLTPPAILEGLLANDIFDLVKESCAEPQQFDEEMIRMYLNGSEAVIPAIALTNGRVLECSYAPILADNEIAGHLWQFKDITASTQARQDLIRAKEQAEESVRAKENFLANISHEMRTPMNGVLGMADLLGKTQLTQEQKNFLHLIKSSGQSLLFIINDILDAAKIKSGKLHLERIPFNLEEVVSTAFRSLVYKAEEKQLQYHLDPIEISSPNVEGDPHRLNQVLINLLNNALKFTSQGEVQLSVQVLNETDSNLTLEFLVKDTGIGIAAENLNIIFEGFTQVHAGSDRKFGGTGLGLSISKSLVQQMGGDIWVESKLHEGSDFRFVLTFVKAPKPVAEPTEEVDYSSLGDIKILLAEDNEVNLFLTQTLMENWGFRVDVAINGLEAVEKATAQLYDLILMDIQMPEMNGVDATRQIRNLPEPAKAQVPIIALTANAFPEDYQHYLVNGLNDYLSKPYKEHTLFQKISTNLGNAPRVTGAPTNSLPINKPEEKLYDLTHLYTMCRGNEAFFNKMLQVFIDTVPTSIVALETAMLRQDWLDVAETAHKLKTSFDTMRVARLKPMIRKLEADAKKRENLDTIPAQVEQVTNITRTLLDQLRADIKS